MRKVQILRRVTICTRRMPVTITGLVVCHAGAADVPRRRGRRAMPAWQTCHAGVANNYVPFENRKIPCKIGYMPLRNGAAWPKERKA